MRGLIRWGSFVYSMMFALMSEYYVEADFADYEHWAVPAFAAASCFLMNCGNFFYSMRLPSAKLAPAWRWLVPYFVLYVLARALLTPDMADMLRNDTQMAGMVWLFGFLFFMPALWANMKIARYPKRGNKVKASPKSPVPPWRDPPLR